MAVVSEGCQVLPGFFGLLVQGVLFACCVGILVLKKVREGAGRSWFEFILDGSKQIIGAGYVHVLNLIFARQMGDLTAGGDECEWYWINIMVDTTAGVAIEYGLLLALTALAVWSSPQTADDWKTGEYYGPGGTFMRRIYLKQLALWVGIVTLMKISVLIFMLIFSYTLSHVAHWILHPFLSDDALKLVFVMIATPMGMNAFQFWVVDNFIKRRSRAPRRDSYDNNNALTSLQPIDSPSTASSRPEM